MTFRSLRLLALVPALSILTGCSQLRLEAGKFINHLQTLQQNQEPHQSKAKTEHKSVAKTHESETPPAKIADIHQITRMLDDGKFEEARHQLRYYVRKHPDDAAAKSYLYQVSVDPKKELGQPVRKYTVKSGDTLGGIAAHYLGNPMQFVILARYNDIRRSRDLKVGEVLSIPAEPDKSNRQTTPKTTTTATAEPPVVSESGTDNTASSAPKSEPELTDAQRQKARALQTSGLEELKAHKDEQAYHNLKQALAINPNLEPAKATASKLQAQLVRKYHEQALAAYRDQKLKKAIALWNKALDIDPNYEPAQGYRARALELQRRLQQLEKKKESDSAH